MRLQTEQREITAHRALGDVGDGGGRAHAPLGGVVGLALHHQVNQFRHLLIVVSARAPRPQFVVQTSKSALLIAARPWLTAGALTPQRRATSRLDWPSPD